MHCATAFAPGHARRALRHADAACRCAGNQASARYRGDRLGYGHPPTRGARETVQTGANVIHF